MAAKNLDELLAQLNADQRKLFENTLKDNPELRDGWTRQDDYSRKMNELSSKEKEFKTLKERNEALEAWSETNVPIWESLVERKLINEDGEDLVTPRITALEQELNTARKQAVGGEDMKPEELEQRVRDIMKAAGGQWTKDEMNELVKAEAKKMASEAVEERLKAEETKFNEKTIPFMASFATGVNVLASRYEKESGEQWTEDKQKELFELMNQKKEFNPYKLEEDFLRPVREKKATEEKIEAEVQKRLRAERSQRAEQGGDGDFIPQPGDRKGALREMLERQGEAEGDLQTIISAQAAKAGAELRAAGKA